MNVENAQRRVPSRRDRTTLRERAVFARRAPTGQTSTRSDATERGSGLLRSLPNEFILDYYVMVEIEEIRDFLKNFNYFN